MSQEIITNIIDTITCQFHTIPEKYYPLEESKSKPEEEKKLSVSDDSTGEKKETLFINIPKEDDLSSAEVSPIKEKKEVEVESEAEVKVEMERELPHIYRKGEETSTDYFGILNVKLNEVGITKRNQFVKFTCDMSGSMDDICSDGRNKMQHSVHTIKNILQMLSNISEENDIKIYVQITGFDDEIEKIIPATEISQSNVDELILKLRKLYSRGSTNIGKALLNAKEEIDMFQTENISDGFEITHIFTTDGNPTSGIMNKEELRELVDDNYKNVFIGFGTDHSADTLLSLSSKKKGDYYVIDKIENGGLVFGDIIHSMLYKAMTNVSIKVKNCSIYNYETDTWSEELNLDYLVSDANKTYHLLAKDPLEVEVDIYASILTESGSISENKQIGMVKVNPELVSQTTDLSKYIFKQKTRELLYQAKCITLLPNKEIRNFRKILNKHLGKIKKYIEKYELTEDEYYTTLCDDIVVTMKTLGTYYGTMFISARHRSNGREQSYNVTEIPVNQNYDNVFMGGLNANRIAPGCGLRRANAFPNNHFDDEDQDAQFGDEEDHSQHYTISRVPLMRSQTSDRCRTLMRDASAGIESTQEYFDIEEEKEKEE